MIRKIITITLITLLLLPTMALASDISNAQYYGIITVSNNSTATTNVATTANISTTNLIAGDYLNATANNAVIRNTSGADVPFMPGFTPDGHPWCMWVPIISADSYLSYILYTANSTGGDINYFPGAAGMTTADNNTMELDGNFIVEQKGWVDTTYTANKSLVYKPVAFRTYISGTGNITSAIPGKSGWDLPTSFVNGGGWTNETNAYDDNTTTFSQSPVLVGGGPYSTFLELQCSTANATDSIRIYISGTLGRTIVEDIDAYYDGAWHGVSEAVEAWNVWVEKPLGGIYEVSNIRIRAKSTAGGDGRLELRELHYGAYHPVSVTATGISSANMTVTTRQTTNLLLTNPDFEDGGTPPTGWTRGGGASTSFTDTVTKRINASSANLTRNGNDSYLMQPIQGYLNYASQSITLGAWVWCDVANAALLHIRDNGTFTASAYHSGGSDWEWLTVTRVINAAPTVLEARVSLYNSDTTAYFDAVVLVAGEDFTAFEGNMLSNWSFELGDPPTGWSQTRAILSQESSIIKVGANSIKIVANDVAGGDFSYARRNLPEYINYRGVEVTLGAWCLAPSGNDKTQSIGIVDSGGYTESSAVPKDNNWHWVTVSRTIDGATTLVRPVLFAKNSGDADVDDILYVDGAVFVVGTTTPLDVTKRIGHLQILVDGIWYDSSGNVTVPDNSNNWIFVQNDSMLYMESHQISVNGTLRQHIEWEYDNVFTDLSAYDNDATPSFRTASSDLDVSANMTSFQPIAEAKAPDYTLAAAPPFLTAPNITGNFTTAPLAPPGGFPLAWVITAVAGALTPPQLPLMIIAIFIILTASLSASYTMRKYGSGSLIIKSIVIIAIMGIFVALQNFGFDFWMVFVFIIIATSICMGSRQIGWS